MEESTQKTVVVAGASGFVGRAIPDALEDTYRLVGLTRRPWPRRSAPEDGYEWRHCDLFSRRQTIQALRDADAAVYLVHSMRPSAALTQGEIRDLDVLCADNFARAAEENDVRHIVYVGPYRASRPEVAETLSSRGASVTTLRTGLVIGPGSAAIELARKLVARSPVIGLPRWTRTRTRPIAREDLAELVRFALDDPRHTGEAWDVAGPDTVSFADVLRTTAEFTERRRLFVPMPFEFIRLSASSLALFTGQPISVTRPIVESFRRDTLPDEMKLQEAAGQKPAGFRESLRNAIEHTGESTSRAITESDERGSELVAMDVANKVRSVQRLPVPEGRTARWVAGEYARWLPSFLRPMFRVDKLEDGTLHLFLRPIPVPLLELPWDRRISRPDRQLYWIRGGLLDGGNENGRLEFRRIPGQAAVLAAVHDFRPRLPWFIYVLTQAWVHLVIMQAFRRHLAGLQTGAEPD